MAQPGRVLAAKPDDPSSIPGDPHGERRELTSESCPLTSHMWACMWRMHHPRHAHTQTKEWKSILFIPVMRAVTELYPFSSQPAEVGKPLTCCEPGRANLSNVLANHDPASEIIRAGGGQNSGWHVARRCVMRFLSSYCAVLHNTRNWGRQLFAVKRW